MKTYALNIIPKIKQFSKKLDSKTVLLNQKWVLLGETGAKSVYIFRPKKELLVSVHGKLTKGSWELIDSTTLTITLGSASYLLNHGFLDNKVLALNLDGSDEFAIFFNENKFEEIAKSLEDFTSYLNTTYSATNQAENPPTVNTETKPNNLVRDDVKIPETQTANDLWFILIMTVIFLAIAFIGITAYINTDN